MTVRLATTVGLVCAAGAVPCEAVGPVTFVTLAGRAAIGSADGTGEAAQFFQPDHLAVDTHGTVYVADTGNSTIRKITPAPGEVTTLAGLAGNPGSTDGLGSAARFSGPEGIAVDSAGMVYVSDYQNSTIRKITPTGQVTTLAGLAGNPGSADGTGSAARFSFPAGIAVDSAGTVYVADSGNSTIRKITPAGVVTTLAGTAGLPGSVDGTGSAARFSAPIGIAVDNALTVYVADTGNFTIRKVTPGAVVTTLAGLAGVSGNVDGTGSAARFTLPTGLAVNGGGTFVYVADEGLSTIRRITSAGVVTTFAGLAGNPGSTDGTGSAARFRSPVDLAVDGAGFIYVADTFNCTIRVITQAADVTTLAGSTPGSVDATGVAAQFDYPSHVAVDTTGTDVTATVYVVDANNSTIRKITPAGVVTTMAGLAGSPGSADGTASAARFNFPRGLAVDRAGTVYVADTLNSTIRRITPGGVVTTWAGLAGSPGSTDGTASAARFNSPTRVAVDNNSGTVYVADSGNFTIRAISPGGVVTTLAGLAGSDGSSDGMGSAARFTFPTGIAVANSGLVFVADDGSSTIRTITPAGLVTTVAGVAGAPGILDGTGSAARFNRPDGVAVDGAGNAYVADTASQTIRLITPGGVVTTIAGAPTNIGSANGTGNAARFFNPEGIAATSTGTLYVADQGNNIIRVGTPGCGTITLSATTFPADTVGVAYPATTLTVVGALGPTTFAMTGGALPAGMVLSPAGTVSGTPTVSGTFHFTVTATDGYGCTGSAAYTVTINPINPPPVILVQPVSQTVASRQNAQFTVAASGTPTPTYQWQLSTDGGSNWITLINNAPYTGVTTPTLTVSNAILSLRGDLFRAVVSNSNGSATSNAAMLTVRTVVSNFDGDTKTDLAVFRPSNGTWYIRYSSLGYSTASYDAFQWGLPGDIPIAGDFDGDGKTDLAVFRPSNGTWYIRYSSLGYSTTSYGVFQWGLPGDIPIAGDFDGDGITELAVFRPSNGTWYIRYSSLGYSIPGAGVFQWGLPGDVPITGDFDGDGMTELTVFRPSNGTWYIRYSSLGYGIANAGVFQWGLPGDLPLIGDFDGDGKAELAVYRPSIGGWFIRYSSLGYSTANSAYFQWGLPGDVPTTADFDGDGRTELTVFRPPTGEWFIRYSSLGYDVGSSAVYQWGLPGDALVKQ